MTDDSEGARSTVLERTEYVENGVVQLRFADMDDSVMDLNAAEAAEVLQGMVEFTGQLARAGALGDGPLRRCGSAHLARVLRFGTSSSSGRRRTPK